MMDDAIKAQVSYRMEEARESLCEAQLLLENNRFRGTVNRTYYAAFYAASALTLTKGCEFSKHSAVISFFDREFVKTRLVSVESSKTLHRAFNERQEDDYLPFVEFDRNEVASLLKEVTALVAEVDAYVSR